MGSCCCGMPASEPGVDCQQNRAPWMLLFETAAHYLPLTILHHLHAEPDRMNECATRLFYTFMLECRPKTIMGPALELKDNNVQQLDFVLVAYFILLLWVRCDRHL